MLLLGLAIVFGLVAFVCNIIVLIDAFQNEVWKGILSLFCGFYLLYYMFAEFSHEKKGLILAGSIGAGIIGTICNLMWQSQNLGL
jgi:hypothetical protein